MEKDNKEDQHPNDIKESSSKEIKQTKISTKYRLINKYESVDLGITSDFYSDISYIKAEEIKNYLKPTSNHGLTGLKNLGNSSYINSIIQCLSNTPELMYYYVSGLYKKDLKISEGKKKGFVPGKLSKEFADLLGKMWIENKKVVSPQDVKYSICDLTNIFNNNNQHDSSEFLMFLFNFLHDEINKDKSKGSTSFYEPPKKENESDISASQRFWNLFKKKNNSIITDLFYGQIRNITRCLSCGHSVTTFEIFNILPIEIPTLKKVSILLVPSNNIKKTIKLNIFVSAAALLIDLGVYIRQYISNGFENFRILLINYSTKNAKFVKMSENIFNTAKKGSIIVYEINDTLEEDDIKEDNIGENNEKENDDNEENSAEIGDYFPFITLIKYKKLEDTEIIDNNFKSYPRIFVMGPYTKVRGLRIKMFGYLTKYYPLPESIVNFLKKKYPNNEYMSIDEISNNYTNKKIEIDEMELNDIYYKQYNLFFNENYQKKLNIDEKIKNDISDYLKNFPFICYLTSGKDEKDKLFFSSNNADNQNSFKDNQKINDVIKLIRNKYKVIIYITKTEYIQPLNEITSIMSTKDNSNTKVPTLNDSLIHFCLHEKLEKENEYFCPNCKRNVNAYHKSDIFYMPPYLIISIKRFIRHYLSKTKVQLLKVNDNLNYNIDYIDFDNFVSGPKNPKNIYTLYAVNQHSGSNEGGHYNTACKNFGKWYMFDDHAVFPCDDDMICVPEGYLLFYRRVKDYKKLLENKKNINMYFDFYKNKEKGENDKVEDNKNIEKTEKEDTKEVEEESEGEENEEDEEK
jgi:ubiquitin C-terminal hydrolase